MSELTQRFKDNLNEFKETLKNSKLLTGMREPHHELQYFEQQDGHEISFRNFSMDEVERKKTIKFNSPYGTEFISNFNSIYNSIVRYTDRISAKLETDNIELRAIKEIGIEAKDLGVALYREEIPNKKPGTFIKSFDLYISGLGEFKDKYIRLHYSEVIDKEGGQVLAYGFIFHHYNITPEGEISRTYSLIDAFTDNTDPTTLVDRPSVVLRSETLKELTNKEV